MCLLPTATALSDSALSIRSGCFQEAVVPGATAIEQLLADEEATKARTDSRKAKKLRQKQKKHAHQLNSLSAPSTEPDAPHSIDSDLSEDLADDLCDTSAQTTPAHLHPFVNGSAHLLPERDAPHFLMQQTSPSGMLPLSPQAALASQMSASPAYHAHLSGMSSRQSPTSSRASASSNSPTKTQAVSRTLTGATEEYVSPSLVNPSIAAQEQQTVTVSISKPIDDVALASMGADSCSDSTQFLHSLAAGSEALSSADQSIRKLFCCPLTQVNIL